VSAEAIGRQTWTRREAIDRLRAALSALTDDERSMCQVAAEKGIFCRGFRRWHASEFHRKWRMAIGSSTHLTRPQMETFANLWQLTEQVRLRVGFACDAEALEPGACRGWNEFSNQDLARFCRQILGADVTIFGQEPLDQRTSRPKDLGVIRKRPAIDASVESEQDFRRAPC